MPEISKEIALRLVLDVNALDERSSLIVSAIDVGNALDAPGSRR